MTKRAPFTIPGSLVIRGKLWRVFRESDLAHEDTKTSYCKGITYRDRREIHLAKHKSERAEARTFLHELLHACHEDVRVSKYDEEKFVSDVERPMLRALEQLKWR